MRNSFFATAAVLAVVVAISVVAPASGQAPKKYNPPKTPWGDPDLQGVWNDATSTPLQRPATIGEKTILSDEEAEDFQQSLAFDLSRDRRDGGNAADVNRAYNEHWMDARRLKITADRRTSLIVDPVDGRIPTLATVSPERQRVRATRAEAAARFAAGLPDDFTDMSWPVRCVVRTDVPPYLPTIYNNNFQIFQSPGYVTIAPEMIHSARIIPVDGRPHLNKSLRQWLGDTRGHWEGSTLVIETTNFNGKVGLTRNGNTLLTSADLKLVERLTRIDANTLQYEATVDDPATWTRPWKVAMPFTLHPEYQFFEYACHEGNYAMRNILSAERAAEKAKPAPPPASGTASQP